MTVEYIGCGSADFKKMNQLAKEGWRVVANGGRNGIFVVMERPLH